MVNRRDFIKNSAIAAGAITVGLPTVASCMNKDPKYVSGRPLVADRKFRSTAVDALIEEYKVNIPDKELAWMFENCFPNTLDTTVDHGTENGKADTFVITGDIEAMWLRDSTAQVWPYMVMLNKDEELKQMVAGLVNRQTKCIIIDPYANAFNKEATGSEWENDLTDMKPELHERKWEIDSLCYAIRLGHGYWKETGDDSPFDSEWEKAMRLIVKTFKEQQRKDNKGPYKFQRVTGWQTDTVAGAGYGNPVRPTGLICSTFRPSDDATIYLYLIPSNYFAVSSLRQLAEMSSKILGDKEFEKECIDLAAEVEAALKEHASAGHLDHGEILAYETDGYGNRLFMDDSNVPSLIALPYLGIMDKNDELYKNTRRFILSKDHAYFYEGKHVEGTGSPHTLGNKIWPMGIILRAITSDSDEEIAKCLDMLKYSHDGTGFMHESFEKDDPSNFTRSWFAWANTLFGELIIKLYKERPHLLGIRK